MKCLAAVLFAMLSVNARAVGAHEGVGCQSLDDNSCWHAMNTGASPVDVHCSGYGRSALFAVSSLTLDQLYAYQFCQGWLVLRSDRLVDEAEVLGRRFTPRSRRPRSERPGPRE